MTVTAAKARWASARAVNDTSHQIGGALGVAVVGSNASARYATSLGNYLAGDGCRCPHGWVDAAEQSVGAAVNAAARMSRSQGTAFMDGWSTSLLTASAAALVAAVTAFVLLPSRPKATAAE